MNAAPLEAKEPEAVAVDGATALVFRDAPSWNGRRTAALGALAIEDAAAGTRLFQEVAERLGREGFEALIGPMDGDTWHRYRVVTESDGSSPFLLEPVCGVHDLPALTGAGFRSISSYVSARARIEDVIGIRNLSVPGVTIESWDGSNAAGLIGDLFELSRQIFKRNTFYKPLGGEAFLRLYQPILPAIDPRLVFFARREGQLVGYLFAIPDRLQGARPNTAIMKTYASSVPGAGQLLARAAHRAIHDLGYSYVIHALMHVDNRSRAASARHRTEVFRRYALLGLDLKALA